MKIKNIAAIIGVGTVLMFGTTLVNAQGKAQNGGIRNFDFLNHTYAKGCYTGEGRKTIKVTDGKFADGDDFFNVELKVVYGDVNGDGKTDAIVRVDCGNSAGTYRNFEVDVFTMVGKIVKLIGRIDQRQIELDYKRGYRKGIVFNLADVDPEIEAGRVEIAAYTDGSFASPANITTFDYKLTGTKFVLRGKPKRKKIT
jgi:hypothetical protein